MSNSLKIERLESEIASLKEQNSQLESQAQKLKDELNFVMSFSQDKGKSIFKIRELEEANFDLKTLIARKESEFKLEKRSLEAKHDIELNKLKSEIQLINHKYDTMMRYELYINKIEEANMELTEQIKEMQEKYNEALIAEEKKYEIKLGLVQQKTLNILGESKKNIQSNALKNMNNSYKLINLQVNELHHQLSEQSAMMEELLKQLNKKEKLIQSQKISISVYKEVEKIIVTQNKRLSKMIKRMLESKRIEGETKEYIQESRKFLHILKNEELTETENSKEKDQINYANFNSNFNNSSVANNYFIKNVKKNEFHREENLTKSSINNLSKTDIKLYSNFEFNKSNNSEMLSNDFNRRSYDFNSQSFKSQKEKGFKNPKNNHISLVNKHISKLKLVKNNDIVGLINSPQKQKNLKNNYAENSNAECNSDYYEKTSIRLLNNENIIINDNLKCNSSIDNDKNNIKSVGNENIFAKFLRNTFNNFTEKGELNDISKINAQQTSKLKSDKNLAQYGTCDAKKTNIQSYYQNLNNSNNSQANIKQLDHDIINNDNNNNKNNKNLSNLVSSNLSINSIINIGNYNNIAVKNNQDSILASDINNKDANNSLFASAAKGQINAVKVKSYNNSSLLDDMNSTNEFGNTFIKNISMNNAQKSLNKDKDNLPISRPMEAKSNHLNYFKNEEINNNSNSVNNNALISVKEKEKEVYFEENSEFSNRNDSNNSNPNKSSDENQNIKEKAKNKNNIVVKKIDKTLKNSKYARNNQILDKYQAELIKSRDKEILGLN